MSERGQAQTPSKFTVSGLDTDARFSILKTLTDLRMPFFLLGPPGSGKSFFGLKLMRHMCETLFNGTEVVPLGDIEEEERLPSVKALYVAGSANVTKLDLLGGRTLAEGSYLRKKGLLTTMSEEGGVVFLDEITSLPPQFTILLNEIIDQILNGTAHPNFYVFFAGNPSSYLGANQLPDATLERLILIWFDYYPFEQEVQIVKDMLEERLEGDFASFLRPKNGFDLFVRLMVGLLRRGRRITKELGEQLAISVRSMFSSALASLTYASVEPSGREVVGEATPERLGILRTIKNNLPETLGRAWNNKDLEELEQYMRENGITWDHVRAGMSSIGIFSKLKETKQERMIRSLVPKSRGTA